MGLTFEASGGLGAPGLGAYMTVQNNGPVLGMDQWLVAWALPHDRLEAGTVDGAILVSAGANGAPLRVVNTDSNAKIPVGGSKSFSFRMEAAQVDTIGLSRAPSDLSVNGKICRPGDGRQPAELCVVPSEKPSPSASSFSGVGGGARLSSVVESAWRILQRRSRKSSPSLFPRGDCARRELRYRNFNCRW